MKSLLLALSFMFSVSGLCQPEPERPSNEVKFIPCESLPKLELLESKEAKEVASAFGYNLDKPYQCRKIESMWLGQSLVLQLTEIPLTLDSHSQLTLIDVSNQKGLWVVPISSGMVEYANLANDPHNLGAFNLLLMQSNRTPASDQEWVLLARTYLAIIGKEGAARLATQQEPISCNGGDCTVLLSEVKGDTIVHWSLIFTRNKNIRLEDISSDIQKIKSKSTRRK